MTAAMAALGFGSDQVAGDDLAFQSLYFVGLLLFVMTFAAELVGDRLVRRCGGVLMALTTPGSSAASPPARSPTASPRKDRTSRARWSRSCSSRAGGLTMLVLLVLIVDLLIRSWPVWTEPPGTS